ncbi:Protein SHQ1 [Nakaseomyces bracarensis]|uniref:Protein SHQ1 n=1 Tax=Nakaseomyces bracarensis TaxID=273131 RepID=A0ABR4NR33_9SACH
MITPKFEVTQDDAFIYVNIKITNIRFDSGGLEVVVDKNLFVFHLSPYYLRLRFPYEVLDDEDHRATAEYKSKEETIFVKIPKANKGQFFEDLDLPTKLLARQGDILGADMLEKTPEIKKGPLIQEVGSSTTEKEPEQTNLEQIGAMGEQFDWEIKQEINDSENNPLDASFKYGFDNQYNGIIVVSLSNGNDINELNDPENTNEDDRITERLNKEKLKFDPDYYVSEYMISKYGDEEELSVNGIKRLLQFTPNIIKDFMRWYENVEDKDSTMPLDFTEFEQNQMMNNIPRKQYLVSDINTIKRLYLTIMNLLFAYIYDCIENEDAKNTESAWNIGKLTPQIAFLDQKLRIQDDSEISMVKVVIYTAIRRALSYPLHRNFELSMKSWEYVYYLLRGGKKVLIRVLLAIHEIYRYHDAYYVYNKVLLDDLVSWFINNGNETIIRSLAIELKKELDTMTKEIIEFDCLAGLDEETGEPSWVNMNIREMEILAESEYQGDTTTN